MFKVKVGLESFSSLGVAAAAAWPPPAGGCAGAAGAGAWCAEFEWMKSWDIIDSQVGVFSRVEKSHPATEQCSGSGLGITKLKSRSVWTKLISKLHLLVVTYH